MTDYTLNVNLDYVNRTAKSYLVGATSLTSGLADYPNGLFYKMLNEQGATIATSYMTFSYLPGLNTFQGQANFGLTYTEYAGGFDSSIVRTDLSGVYISDATSMWEFSQGIGAIPEVSLFGIDTVYIRPTELYITGNPYGYLDTRSGQYIGTPLLITRGDAVYQGSISTVLNKNLITLTNNRAVASYTGYNMSDCIVQVISGAASGQTFAVTSHTIGSSTLTVDTDCSALSGQVVKVMPYRLVDGYSGATYRSLAGTNLGANGYQARFALDDTIPAKVGSIAYTSGYYSGVAVNITHPGYILAPTYTGAVVCLKQDAYGRTLSYGDVIYYNPASSPASTYTGMIVSVANHSVQAQGEVAVTYWPPYPAYTGSVYTIHRSNKVHLQSFPALNGQVTSIVIPTAGGVSSQFITSTNTPSAVLDVTANEYESTYNNITETSHFHIGPVHLSNGQVLNDELTMTGNVPPYSRFHVKVTNGDPASPTTVVEKTAFSTQDPNVGERFNGMYHSNGTLTVAADTSFNASQTITCQSDVRYGSIVVNKTVLIPVQPAV